MRGWDSNFATVQFNQSRPHKLNDSSRIFSGTSVTAVPAEDNPSIYQDIPTIIAPKPLASPPQPQQQPQAQLPVLQQGYAYQGGIAPTGPVKRAAM